LSADQSLDGCFRSSPQCNGSSCGSFSARRDGCTQYTARCLRGAGGGGGESTGGGDAGGDGPSWGCTRLCARGLQGVTLGFKLVMWRRLSNTGRGWKRGERLRSSCVGLAIARVPWVIEPRGLGIFGSEELFPAFFCKKKNAARAILHILPSQHFLPPKWPCPRWTAFRYSPQRPPWPLCEPGWRQLLESNLLTHWLPSRLFEVVGNDSNAQRERHHWQWQWFHSHWHWRCSAVCALSLWQVCAPNPVIMIPLNVPHLWCTCVDVGGQEAPLPAGHSTSSCKP
jgi:hypothetical protein